MSSPSCCGEIWQLEIDVPPDLTLWHINTSAENREVLWPIMLSNYPQTWVDFKQVGVWMGVRATIQRLLMLCLLLRSPSFLLEFAIIQKKVLLYPVDLASYTCWNGCYIRFYQMTMNFPLFTSKETEKYTQRKQFKHTCVYVCIFILLCRHPYVHRHMCWKASRNRGLHSSIRGDCLKTFKAQREQVTACSSIYYEWAWVCNAWKIFRRKLALN